MRSSLVFRRSPTVLLLAFYGCIGGLEDAGSKIEKGTKNIESAADKAKEGMEKISEGLKAFDATGVVTVLKENKELRARLEEAQAKLNDILIAGGITLAENRRVFFKIEDYSGEFRVSGWVDEETNSFMSNLVLSNSAPSLGPMKGYCGDAIEEAAQRTWRNVTGKPMDGHLWGVGDQGQNGQGHEGWKALKAAAAFARAAPDARAAGDKQWTEAVKLRFEEYSKAPFTRPRDDGKQPFAVDRRLRFTGGQHVVRLRVKPTALDLAGQWVLRYTLYAEIDGKTEILTSGRIDQESHGDWPIGSSKEIDAGSFDVRVVSKL